MVGVNFEFTKSPRHVHAGVQAMTTMNDVRRTEAISVRRFLRKPLILSVALAMSAVTLPAYADWWSATPSVSIGSTTINVKTKGALGNGQHDDTAAFQAAINALPSSGGTVTVPAGTYMIDALRSINMRSHTRLKLDPNAQLVAIPNSSTRYHVIKAWNVNNVEITGGRIVGERAKHRGTTGEWGYGINIQASNRVNVRDVHLSNFWGDGMWIGAIGRQETAVVSTDVTLNNVTSTNNRRQGLSIGPADRVYVVNSTFSNSNGTAPQAGIDLEPMGQGDTRNIRIENTVITGNRGTGLEMHDNVSGVVVKKTTIKGNNGFGVLAIGPSNLWVAGNVITENGLDGVNIASGTSNVRVTNNTITYNSTRYFLNRGLSIYTRSSSGLARDIEISSSATNVVVSGNTFSP